MNEKEYKNEIIKMVQEIKDLKTLKLIFGFTKTGFREEMAGKK